VNVSNRTLNSGNWVDSTLLLCYIIVNKIELKLHIFLIKNCCKIFHQTNCLLLAGFDSGFGDFSTGAIAFLDGFDDTNGNGLSHISDGESS